MKICRILRGIPGSGKSTLAQVMRKQAAEVRAPCSIVSTDNYFLRPDGRYSWKGDDIPFAHDWARRELELTVNAFNGENHLVIVDNCNIKHSDYGSYAAIASTAGYQILLDVVGTFPPSEANLALYAQRNCHGVTLESLRRIAARWEP